MYNERSSHQALHRLEAGPGVRLVLLLGPASSGKTALLQHWVSGRQRALALLVNLAAQDDSPCAFISKLIHSLNDSGFPSDEAVEGRNQGLTNFDYANLSLEAKSALLLSILEETPQGFALILDHFHRISHPNVYEIVETLLDYLPPQVYVVIASRAEPPLQVSRLRVRRELVEIEI